MPSFLLRVEAVNLDQCLNDTEDLSTRRGGGLMLLNAVSQMTREATLQQSVRDRLTSIATGASIGLFRFEATNEGDAAGVAETLREHFRSGSVEFPGDGTSTNHLLLKYATFVVDIEEIRSHEPHAESEAHQRIVAKIRWQQMQQFSVSIDGVWNESRGPCAYNMVRPSITNLRIPKNREEDVCQSVFDRHHYGRFARQHFYRAEWVGPEEYPDYSFTNEFKTLTEHPNGDRHNLHEKLAVFYVDGNGFGSKGREIFRTQGAEGFRKWSDGVKVHHRELLKRLLMVAADDPLWRQSNGELRIETLLWGGDEILWVVPAWKGWELAKWFFEQTHAVNDEPVTYGCGLIFCHATAPIRNITSLAQYKLGDIAKSKAPEGSGHSLAYEVLESIDDVQCDMNEHRGNWLPDLLKPTDQKDNLVIDPANLKDCWLALKALADSSEFPKRQLYQLCHDWRRKRDYGAAQKRVTADEFGKHVQTVKQALGCSEVAYLHLLQMLPYIPTNDAESHS